MQSLLGCRDTPNHTNQNRGLMLLSRLKKPCTQRWRFHAPLIIEILPEPLQTSPRIFVSDAHYLITKVRNVTLKNHVDGKEPHETNKRYTVDSIFLIERRITALEIITTIIIGIIENALALPHAHALNLDRETTTRHQHPRHKMNLKRKSLTLMPLVPP